MAKTDYLRWSANSMKELINDKLTEQGVFTDQNFEGSNLSVFIDIFSYVYDVLTYYLNIGATEAIFSDTQLYENINRIVKELGYNPVGFITSTASCAMSINQLGTGSNNYIIPRYSTVNSGISDSDGGVINYTFVNDYGFLTEDESNVDPDFTPTLYNGTWKLYNETIISTGIPFETYTLLNLDLSSDDRVFIAHPFINVFVKDVNTKCFNEYVPVLNIYESDPSDLHFELRLNENKQYTIKFGDDINGKKLNANDIVYIVYLQSNGPDGQIGVGQITDGELEVKIEGLTTLFIENNLLGVKRDENSAYLTSDDLTKISLTNEEPSTVIKDFETVEEIRLNAPNWFRMQGRLTTETDFKQYILTYHKGDKEIHDVSVQNDSAYLAEYLQWLYQNTDEYGNNYLNSDIIYFKYKYADSTDFNNVYIWLKSASEDNVEVSPNSKQIIERDLNRLKPLTSEVVILDPFLVSFMPYVSLTDIDLGTGTTGSTVKPNWNTLSNFDPDYKHTIEIVRDRNTMVSVEKIRKNAVNILETFFNVANNYMGGSVDIADLHRQLLLINGVKQINTKYLNDSTKPGLAKRFSGLSFAVWTPLIIKGADFNVINGIYKLNSFQFPFLYNSEEISKRIEVTSENYKVNEIEY